MRSHVEHAPRILLLTSGLGTGHSRAMTAVEKALLNRVPAAVVRSVDFWSLINVEVGQAIQQTYLQLVTEHPDLYHGLYQLDQRSWRDILERGAPLPSLLHKLREFVVLPAESKFARAERHWFDRLLYRQLLAILERDSAPPVDIPFRAFWQQAAVHRSWSLLTRRLQRLVERFAPDIVVATQVNMAALAAHLKDRGHLHLPLVGVITDYGVHDFWLQRQIDAYCVPDPSLLPTLQHRSAGAVECTGMPLSADFRHLPDASQARVELGLPLDRPVVLLLGGGLGLGIESTIHALLAARPQQNSPHLIVLAGRNERLLRSVLDDAKARTALAQGTLHMQGWTDRVATFLRAADLIVGKPGGLTTAEVLAAGRPLFFTSSLGGQEAFNVSYLESHGVGRLVDEPQLPAQVFELLSNRGALQELQSRAAALGTHDGAERVAECVLDRLPPRAALTPGRTRQQAKVEMEIGSWIS